MYFYDSSSFLLGSDIPSATDATILLPLLVFFFCSISVSLYLKWLNDQESLSGNL